MRPFYVATSWLLVSLLVPAVMAELPTAVPTMMFSEWLHALKAGTPSRTKLMSSNDKSEVKHICLQETRQHNCHYIGCPNVQTTDDTCSSGQCANCRQGTAFMSDFTCCGEREGHYGYGDKSASFGSSINGPTFDAVLGTCDWGFNMHIVDLLELGENGKDIQKLGGAWATCYLRRDAEHCSDALCAKMVLTFQGGLYMANVRSTLPADLSETFIEQSCLGDASKWFFQGVFPYSSSKRSTSNTATLTNGVAFVLSGAVTITSVDRAVEYSHGYMDYVPRFGPGGKFSYRDGASSGYIGVTFGAADSTTLPIITPNTYNIKLVSNKKASY